MKFRVFLVPLSISLNAALLAAFLLRPAATTAWVRDAFRSARSVEPSASNHPPADDTDPTRAAARPAAAGWPEFQSGDFTGLVARLRAAGFPPSIVRAIVTTAVAERYNERRRALLPRPVVAAEYWKNPRPNAPFDLKAQAALRELGREQTKLLKELLGPDFNRPDNDEWFLASQRRQFGDLPPEKIDQLRKISSDYNDLTAKVHEDSLGIMLPEDRAKLALLEREQRADLERLLSPDELLDYDLRNSRAANVVRGRLGRFEVTEEEFRALYAAQQSADEQNSPAGLPPPGPIRDRGAALDAQFRSVLGDERYAEFKRANESGRPNGNEELVGRLVTRLNLPPAATAAVLSVQTDIQQRVAAVRTDRTLSLEQRNTQLAALATEASTRLTDTLGATGLEAYRQYGGQWLQMLNRPMPSRPMPLPSPIR
jgi:hypothetical protein